MSSFPLLAQQRRAPRKTTQPAQRVDNFTAAYLQSVSQWEQTSAGLTKVLDKAEEDQEKAFRGGPQVANSCDNDVGDDALMLSVIDGAADVESVSERARFIRNCKCHFQDVLSLALLRSNDVCSFQRRPPSEELCRGEPQSNNTIDAPEVVAAVDCDAPQLLISGPAVQRPSDGWDNASRLLLDEDEDGADGALADPCAAGSGGAPLTDVNRLIASAAHDVKDDELLTACLHEMLNHLWVEEHPDPDFDTEAQRAKLIPRLIEGSMKYLAQLTVLEQQFTTGSSTSGILPLVSKYPPPQFYDSPLSKETNRLMRWLQTWRREHIGSAAAVCGDCPGSSAGADSEDDAASESKQREAERQQLLHGSNTFLFDNRGRRLSARIARNEALQKAKEEEEERMRQQQKGYFSNDTSGLGSVCTAGGAGARTNIAVLSGPCGIGKTTAAYLAAGHMDYRVVEINTSTKRTAKGIEKFVSEATQSRQIQHGTSKSAGRDELQRWKDEAEIRDREAQRILEAERLRLEKEAAAKRAQEEAAAAQEAAAARLQAKRAAGVKKVNAISKSAIVSFFQPKKKQPPPSGAEVVNVDDVQGTHISNSRNDAISVDEDSQQAAVVADKTTKGDGLPEHNHDHRKRPRSDDVVPPTTEGGGKKRGRPSKPQHKEAIVIPHEDVEEVLGRTEPAPSVIPAPPAAPPVKRERLPLILIESADVIMEDELMRPFYAAVRAMAAESKFPIVVTANVMTSQHAASYFGPGTPHAAVQPPTALYVILQLFLVTLVEKHWVALTAVAQHKRPRVRLVKDRCGAQQLDAAAAMARSIVLGISRSNPNHHVDVRRCIFALQFQLLCPATTSSTTAEEGVVQSPTSPLVARDASPPSNPAHALCSDASLLAVVDRMHATTQRTLSAASALQLAVDANSDDDDESGTTDQATIVAPHDAAPLAGAGSEALPTMAPQASSQHLGETFEPVHMHVPRIALRQHLVTTMHRTRAMTAKAYGTRSPTTLLDVLSFGKRIVNATATSKTAHHDAKSTGNSPLAQPKPPSVPQL